MKYHTVVFLDGDDYRRDGCDDMTAEEMFRHLKQWDYGEYPDLMADNSPPWGRLDRFQAFAADGSTTPPENGEPYYVVSWNTGLGYCALTFCEESGDE